MMIKRQSSSGFMTDRQTDRRRFAFLDFLDVLDCSVFDTVLYEMH